MKHVTAWFAAVAGFCDRYRHPLLLATVGLACFFYYILFKWMAGNSLHALAQAYAQAEPTALELIRRGTPLQAPRWVQALELTLDTLLFPAYSALLWRYASHYPPVVQPTRLLPPWAAGLLNGLVPWLPALILLGA